MGFFRRLFSRKPKKYVDERGLYYYVDCHKCHNVLKVRIDKQYDLNRQDNGSGFVWRKTLVCSKCFNKMGTEMVFSNDHSVLAQDITGGKYVAKPEPPAPDTSLSDSTDAVESNDTSASADSDHSGQRGFG